MGVCRLNIMMACASVARVSRCILDKHECLVPKCLQTESETSQARVRIVLGPKSTKGPKCLVSEKSCYFR